MYKLIISPRAKKELKKLKDSHKIAIVSVLDEIKEDPFSGKSLTRELTGRFSFRVGVYRIIYKINKKDSIIDVLSAGHRGKVYE